MSDSLEPKLAPPGAGLPKPELLIARLLFALRWRTGNRGTFNASFTREREVIRKLAGPLNAADAARRVLIRRVPGLEDSSRYWSVWMTLDHLRIVNRGITETIRKLTHGQAPERKASTAAVKPSAQVTVEVASAYEKSCDALLETVASADNLKTKLRHAHPWFGPLNAFQWHAMAGSHMGIHRIQIERIVRGLPNTVS
jgi:hypothetical protein